MALVYWSEWWMGRVAQQCPEIKKSHLEAIAAILPKLTHPVLASNALFEIAATGRLTAEDISNLQEYLHPDDLCNSDRYWLQSIKRYACDFSVPDFFAEFLVRLEQRWNVE